MKVIVLVCFCSIISIHFSQLTENKGNIHFKISTGKTDSATYQNYSIGGEWFVTKHLGLNYNFDFVHRNDNMYQLHSSAGLIVGPPLIGLGIISLLTSGDNNNDGEKDANLGTLGIIGGLLLLILPEGISYHIPIKYNWDISAYANVLGVDYLKNNKPNVNKSYIRYTATFGSRITYWNPKNFTLFSFFEARKTAGMNWSLGGGLGLGYAI